MRQTASTGPLHFDAAQSDDKRDQFGFQTLADNVSDSVFALLAAPPSDGSFVVGLEGRWGSGKSTILNYVRNALEARLNRARQFLVDFDPWWLEEGVNIASSLLATVTTSLPKEEATAVQRAVGSLADAVSKMPDGVSALLKMFEKTTALGEFLEATKIAGGDLAGILNAGKPARQLRKEVAKAFAEGQFQFVVFIDDLDRLTPQQALQVLSAIRSIADLPGFVYVLAYDPRALENILKGSTPPLGHDYIEKIVNVSVPVPPITFGQMETFTANLLSNDLWIAIKAQGSEAHLQALISLLDTPRDAIRFANAANFWIGSKTGEVFVPDFLVLEAVRLAKPTVYEGLLRTADVWLDRTERDALGTMLGEKDDKAALERKRARVDAELDLRDNEEDRLVRRALSVLFPGKSDVLGQDPIFRPREKPDKQSISVSDHFFTYFLHRPLPGAATKAEVEELVAGSTSVERRTQIVAEISSRPSGDVAPLRHLIAMIDARIDRDELARGVAIQIAEAFAAPTTTLNNAGSTYFDTDLNQVRNIVTRLMMSAQNVSDDELARFSSDQIGLSMLALLHVTITSGTSFYLLKPVREERPIVNISENALREMTRRLLDRIFVAIRSEAETDSPIAPWFYYMAFKGRSDDLKNLMDELSLEPGRLVRLVELYRGYENPIHDIAGFFGTTPQDIAARVQADLSALGRDREEWRYWQWFEHFAV